MPYTFYKKYAIQGLMLSIILLILTLVPGFGIKALGAKRWLNLGFFQLQPVEIAKFFVAVFLALSLDHKKEKIRSLNKGLFPVLIMVVIPILIIAKQPDLGSLMVIGCVTFVLLFLANARIIHLFGLILIGISGVLVSVLINPYQLKRITAFLSPWDDPLGKNYHVIQSLIAIGSGGFLGNGIGQSKLKYYYLPMHYTDFIFAIVCEEGGFILAAFVVILFALLFYRGSIIAFRADNDFAKYLAIALTLFLVIQGFINIGVVIGILPVTGIPLTFFSFGGTALVTSMFYMGVLLNISRKVQK